MFLILSGRLRPGWRWGWPWRSWLSAARLKIKKGEKQDSNYGLEGMCLGMCFGTALGTALGNNTGVGLSLGMLLGLAIGSCIPRGRKDADE